MHISVNYIIKLIHLAGTSFTFQLIFRKLFVHGEKNFISEEFQKEI